MQKWTGYLKLFEDICGHWNIEAVLIMHNGDQKTAKCKNCFDTQEAAVKAGKEFLETIVSNPRYDSPT